MTQMTVGYSMMESPIGPLLLASTEQGLCFIEFGPEETSLTGLNAWCRKWKLNAKVEQDDVQLATAKHQLEEYFAGQRQSFAIPLDLYGTVFQKAVWMKLTEIPYGELRSYKEMALAIGSGKAVRAIGGANNKNPIPIVIPCHRVVGSNGSLVGYGGGISIKEHLLALEGTYDPVRQSIV